MVQADQARIVTLDSGEELVDVPADGATIGEIVMRGNNVMKGYFRDVKATEEAFRGGWFHSGDLGVMHEDGYIELRDRSKDIIVSGGENISTVEIEQAISSHPAVLEVAVIGVPHPRLQEIASAVVVLRKGADPLGLPELRAFLEAKGLAKPYWPERLVTLDELPRTPSGKIQKYVLRQKLAALAAEEESSA